MSNQPTDSDTPGPVGADMYDDPADGGVDYGKLLDRLCQRAPQRWGQASLKDGAELLSVPRELQAGVSNVLGIYEQQIVADVLAALMFTADATLVKNDTYRMLRRDGAAVERLNAWLQNHGVVEAIVEHNGDAVAALIALDPFDWES